MYLFFLGCKIWLHTVNLFLLLWNFALLLIRRCFSPDKQQTMSQSKLNTPNKQFPVIVEDNKSGYVYLSKLIPSIKVPFYGVVGSVKSVKRLKSGSWYVECHSQAQQEQLLATKDLAGVSVSCYLPTPTSDGVVYGLSDPLTLREHPDVIKFQITSNTNTRANSYTTRIVFAKETLPNKLFINDREYDVFPYTTPTPRCTNCQRLTHTKHACNHPTRCSRCGEGHPRAACHAHTPKCANCLGPHSAAFHLCPSKKVHNSNCSETAVISNNSHVNGSSSQAAVPSYASRLVCSTIPTFIAFITIVVLPILALDRNCNILNQLIDIYKTFFNLNNAEISKSVTSEVRENAESLLRATSTKSTKQQLHDDTTTSRKHQESIQIEEKRDRKQLMTLRNIVLKKETQNVILGDSTTKGIQDDSRSDTETFCIPGLTLEDVQEWLKDTAQMKLKNIVLHVGVNSCRNKCISVTMWGYFIQIVKAKFPKANVHFSSILPSRGRLKKNIDGSNSSLKIACDKEGTFFMNNRSKFVTYTGQPLIHLYARDGIHPNKVGSDILTKNLFSVLAND